MMMMRVISFERKHTVCLLLVIDSWAYAVGQTRHSSKEEIYLLHKKKDSFSIISRLVKIHSPLPTWYTRLVNGKRGE